LPQSFFDELRSEVRNKDGTWTQIRKRNESLDLCCYNRAAGLRLGVDKIKDWSKAPRWAQPLATNSELITVEVRREEKENVLITTVPLSKPAQETQVRRPRRVATSQYMTR
jgi:phage terminase large subunit GpA-like protein